MQKKRFLSITSLPFLFLAIGPAFAPSGQKPSFSASTKNGVRIVHNRGPATAKFSARLEFVRQIGKLEGSSQEDMFAFPIHAARDEEGNIYVLDSKDYCIKKFDRTGRFLLRFGRHGQGPGEFQYPMVIGIVGKDRLIVQGMDSSHQIFDLQGSYVGRFQMGRYSGLFMQGMRSSNVVGFVMDPSGENNSENKILKVFDLQGKALHYFGEPLLLSTARHSWTANFLSLAVDPENNIYTAFTYQNRIEKYAPDGRLLMTVDRELPFSVEYKIVKEAMEIGGKAREIERLKSTLVSRGIGVDGRGRIWVLGASRLVPEKITRDAYVPRDYNVFEVYDPDGVLQGRVPLPEILKSFDNFVMSDDSLFFLDPYGQCCVFQFSIVDGGNEQP